MKLKFIGRAMWLRGISIPKGLKVGLVMVSLILGSTNVAAQDHITTQTASFKSKLVLPKALGLALTGNPELEAFSWDLRASDAQVLQAELLPNPVFSFQMEDFGGSGPLSGTDGAELTYMLSQLVEMGGKRSARTSVATRMKTAKESDYEIKRMQVLGDVTIKFFHVAADQERLQLARMASKQALTTLQNIEKRVQAGRSSSVEARKAEVQLSQYKIQEEHAEHELATAKLRLSATWGAQEVLYGGVDAGLFKREPVPTYKELTSALDEAPAVKRWFLEEQVRDAQVELEESNQIPDFTLGLALRRFEETDSNAAVMQLSIPLPLFDRNQHQLSRANSLREKTRAMKKSSRSKVNELIFGVYQELVHSTTEMEESESKILPSAKSALKTAKEGFQRGRFSYLELTDTQDIFIEAQQDYITAALEYQEAVVELEKLTGLSIRKRNSLQSFKENQNEN